MTCASPATGATRWPGRGCTSIASPPPPRTAGPVERARLAQGKAELARARGRGAAKEWQRAAVAWDELERPYPAAIARWREAEALVGADDRAGRGYGGRRRAGGRGGAGLGVAGRARCARWASAPGWTSGIGRRGRRRRPTATVTAGPTSAEADPFGLTPRERQVLALLAEGATNRQIGAALYMAEKTASVHVSRILAKLGVQGRTQAAAVAHRLHLA